MSSTPHTITAVYSGDGNFTGSAATDLAETIGQDTTTTTVSCPSNPAGSGQQVTFLAVVAASAPDTATGLVTFLENGASIGSAMLQGPNGPATAFAALTTTLGSADSPYTITAVYGGDNYCTGSTSANIMQTVCTASTTTLTASADSSFFGQTITFTATVTGSDGAEGTGWVTFLDAAGVLGIASLSSGTATCATNNLGGGAGLYPITAVYGGAGNYAASIAAPWLQMVTPANTTTALISSMAPAVSGQAVTFTATVNPNWPVWGLETGFVVFKDGNAVIGAAPLNINGVASFTTYSLTTATHTITAVYSGDWNFTGSTSTLTQSVVKAATTTTVTSSINPSACNQQVTFTALVSAYTVSLGSPTGTVTFLHGSSLLGTAALQSGPAGLVALVTTSFCSTGTYTITAVYGGDSNFTASTALPLTQTVRIASTATISVPSTSTNGQNTTLTAAVGATGSGYCGCGCGCGCTSANVIATGLITFFNFATSLGTAVLNAGKAVFTTSTLSGAAALNSFSFIYGGDGNLAGSTSTAVTQTVNQANTTTSLSTFSTSSVFRQSVVFTATVTVPGLGLATGLVTFLDGTSTLGTAALNNSVATFTTTCLSVSSSPHTITAVYGGDINFAGSTATPTLKQTVGPASTTTTVTGTATPSAYGQALIFTATVAVQAPGAGRPKGTVSFRDGSTPLGTAILSSGQATLSAPRP